METVATLTPVGDQVPGPRDFDPRIDHYRQSSLLGVIHQRRLHPPLIRALEAITLHTPSVASDRTMSMARCRSCGTQIPQPPLCTRCLTHF
jgi:hypothetical protein